MGAKSSEAKKRARTIFAEGQECWQHTGLFCWCVRKGPGLGSRLPCRQGDRTGWPPRGIVRATQQILTSAAPREAVLLQPLGNSTTQGGEAALKIALTDWTTWGDCGAYLSPIRRSTSVWNQRSLKSLFILLRYLQYFYSCPERNSLRAC